RDRGVVRLHVFFYQAEDGIRDFHVTGVQTCALAISRNWPSITEVTIDEFCFSTPRIIMHMCWASITTATPQAPVTCWIASAISRVRFSWICRRRAYMSTIRATLDRPSTLPLGR